MTVRISRVMSFAEKWAMDEAAIAKGWYREDRRTFLPGMAWFQNFYFDPLGDWSKFIAQAPDGHSWRKTPQITARPANPNDRSGFLSPHYWRDWADKRPPICVVCPNGETWEIDRWSSNGTGWTVTGDPPNITCSPSIIAGNYHGFLRDGAFTDDLERRTYPAPVTT